MIDGFDVLKKCRKVAQPQVFIPHNYSLYENEDMVYVLHKMCLIASFKSTDQKAVSKIKRAIYRHQCYQHRQHI